MAQTIQLVRGTTSINFGTQSPVTLFTNSASYTGTRVILNQLVFYLSGTTSSYPNITLYLQSSGGYASMLGYWYFSSGNSIGGFNIETVGAENPNSIFYGGTSPVTSYGGRPLYLNNNSGAWASGSDSPNVYWNNANVNATNTIPTNFWIGSSDVIRIRASGWGGNTANCGYSFTLVHES